MWCKDNDFYANGKANRIFFADNTENFMVSFSHCFILSFFHFFILPFFIYALGIKEKPRNWFEALLFIGKDYFTRTLTSSSSFPLGIVIQALLCSHLIKTFRPSFM